MYNFKEMIEKQRIFFDGGSTRDISFRLEKLNILEKAVIDNEEEIMKALKMDLNKAPFEAYATEIGFVLGEIKYAVKHLASWAKPKKVKTPLMHFPSSSRIYYEPYGIALIMSPWNYPFQLTLAPLIGSIAAGNCSIVKPSEYSSNTSAVIERLIAENFDESYVAVVRGGREANKTLLNERFDYIFFTGSPAVGKVIMEAASKHLTPVALELGGKSPCIVDETADIELAAKRIVWGKFLNSGQTCVAPDYILVQSSIKDILISNIENYITEFYGLNPCDNRDYPKIINEMHFNRLINLMKDEDIIFGGQYSNETCQIAPTIIDGATWESPVMQEEIFGPLLPVLKFEKISEAISVVNAHAKPLALYMFTSDKANEMQIINSTSFGGGCINDTIIHIATPYMPFGGVGYSGMGGYHGKASFDSFSHKKSILKKSTMIDILLRYPPYKNHLKLLKKLMS